MSVDKFSYGQKWYLKTNLLFKPKEVYIVNKDDDYLIKLSEIFPYTPWKDPHFFLHKEMLIKHYRHESEAVQIEMF